MSGPTVHSEIEARNQCMRDLLDHKRRVGQFLLDRATCLQERAIRHDDSKFMSDEFEAFVYATPKLKELEYGSDGYKKALENIRPAIDLHNERNRHHPEHFSNGIAGMSLCDLIEMLCDWQASVERTKGGDLRRSIELNASRFGYDDGIKNLLLTSAKSWGWI